MINLNETTAMAPWKLYLTAILETVLSFLITTFCMGIYLTHQSGDWLMTVIMVLLYLFSFGVCLKRLIDQFSLAALMLIIPIAPLLILIIIISMVPLLDWLK